MLYVLYNQFHCSMDFNEENNCDEYQMFQPHLQPCNRSISSAFELELLTIDKKN